MCSVLDQITTNRSVDIKGHQQISVPLKVFGMLNYNICCINNK